MKTILPPGNSQYNHSVTLIAVVQDALGAKSNASSDPVTVTSIVTATSSVNSNSTSTAINAEAQALISSTLRDEDCMFRDMASFISVATIVVIFHIDCCITKPRSSSITSYNNTRIAHNHHTNNNPNPKIFPLQ